MNSLNIFKRSHNIGFMFTKMLNVYPTRSFVELNPLIKQRLSKSYFILSILLIIKDFLENSKDYYVELLKDVFVDEKGIMTVDPIHLSKMIEK